jgi:DNA-binding transcriptional LysR family regulator
MEAALEVAEARSFTRAAAVTSEAPTLVWRRVNRLEDSLGVRLFERGAGSSPRVLSAAGEQLLPTIRRILEDVATLESSAVDVRGGGWKRIKVAGYPAHVRKVLAPAVRVFEKSFPGATVELPHLADDQRARGGANLFRSLVKGEVDIAICPGRNVTNVRYSGKLYDWSLVAVDPSWSEPRRPIDALRDAPLITSPSGFTSRDLVEDACHEAGFHPHVAYETPSTEAMLALAEHGLGVAITPDDALPSGRPDAAKIEQLDGRSIGGSYWAYGMPRSGRLDDLVSGFLDVLVSESAHTAASM